MIKTTGWDLFLPLVAFALWTLASFLCHKLAKTAISLSGHHSTSPPLLAPVLVTLWQVATCFSTLTFTSRRGKLFLVMAVSHGLATLATNTSLCLMFASSTLAVKLLEPVTSALIQRRVLDAPMGAESVVSMTVIVAGAVVFVGDPLQNGLFFKGVWVALMSNFSLGVRNVSVKLDQSSSGGISIRSFYCLSAFGIVVAALAGTVYVLETETRAVPYGSTRFLGLCLASSACHVVYSYVSTNVILRCMSVVGHAIANIVKRVLVVVLLHVSGRRVATAWNWAGLVLCTAGLLLYNRRKISASCTSSASDSSGLTQFMEGQEKNTDTSVEPKQKIHVLYRLLFLILCFYLVVFIPSDRWNPRDFASDLRHGHVRWKDGNLLLKDNVTFQPQEKDSDKIESFLQKNLLRIQSDTDQLSPYLTSTREVIDEALRVQTNLLSNLIGRKRYVVLIGAASFENKGDPAITIGQLNVVERLGLKLVFIINEQNCTDDNFHRAADVASSLPPDSLVILMQGGGNIIGYPEPNRCRMKALTYFPSHQTVLLSQSVFLRGSERWVDEMVNAYCCRPRLSILLRDRLSFRIASRLFGNGTRLILAPDMAFGVGPVPRFSPPFHDVLWLKRVDDERPRYDATPAFPPGVSVRVSDWTSGWDTPRGANTVETAHNVLQNGLLFLQRGRVVVTERLHGHILATLLDMPHVVLDNADNKLSSYHHTWTRGLRNVRLAYTAEEAMRMGVELLREFGSTLPPVFPGMDARE